MNDKISMDDKRYLLNDTPVSAMDLIHAAMILDKAFADDWIHTTSEATRILREHGNTVADTLKKETKL